MKKLLLAKITFFVFLAALLTMAFTCSNTKGVMVYGVKWTGLIRSPLEQDGQLPGNPPYSYHEDIKFSGNFGELSGNLSKYNFWLESYSLNIRNDTPDVKETWNDIWYSYYDYGVKSDGSQEAYLKGRCYLTNKKLNTLLPVGPLDFDLRLYIVPGKPYQFIMNIFTTKKGTASDLMVSGKASTPDGVIQFTPIK